MYVTVTENVTILNPIYLFEFINCTTLESVSFISVDTSAFPSRYNEFEVTLNEIQVPLNAVVWLDKGQFYYNIYEQLNTTNLTPSLALGLLESGLGNVIYSNTTTKPSFEYTEVKPQFNG